MIYFMHFFLFLIYVQFQTSPIDFMRNWIALEFRLPSSLESSHDPSASVSLEDCEQASEIFEFLSFQVMSQLVKKVPSLLVSTEGIDLLSMFQCACGCLGLPEADPVRYSANFLRLVSAA